MIEITRLLLLFFFFFFFFLFTLLLFLVMLRGKAMIFMLKNNARVGITLSGGPRTPCHGQEQRRCAPELIMMNPERTRRGMVPNAKWGCCLVDAVFDSDAPAQRHHNRTCGWNLSKAHRWGS